MGAPPILRRRRVGRSVMEIAVKLPKDVLALLRKPSACYLATSMPDGSPQVTQTWVDTDGEHVVINTVQGYVKLQNIARDPRVAVAVADPENAWRYFQIRGHVIDVTTEGGAEHIEMLSRKYTGQPYAWYGGRDQVRTIVTIAAEHVSGMG
jgi:PPOX class probable F420-dependent enzyme